MLANHGTNFLSKPFLNILKENKIIESHSSFTDSLDNRPFEFLVCLKHEWLYNVELNDYKTAFSKFTAMLNGTIAIEYNQI